MGNNIHPVTWHVYLLHSGNRTYIGSTTNPQRRLRQHNGEIVGGARSTRSGRPWAHVLWISGFENRSVACRWERILKCRARGLLKRKKAFLELFLFQRCPQKYSGQRLYPVPEGLSICYPG